MRKLTTKFNKFTYEEIKNVCYDVSISSNNREEYIIVLGEQSYEKVVDHIRRESNNPKQLSDLLQKGELTLTYAYGVFNLFWSPNVKDNELYIK